MVRMVVQILFMFALLEEESEASEQEVDARAETGVSHLQTGANRTLGVSESPKQSSTG